MKLAFRWTRNLRGGPAHAAIIRQPAFGTTGGSDCQCVVHRGVDHPDDAERGFQQNPHAGLRRLLLLAGLIAAQECARCLGSGSADNCASFFCDYCCDNSGNCLFFLSVFASARFRHVKTEYPADWQDDTDMVLERQDFLNLFMIFGPIMLILILALTA